MKRICTTFTWAALWVALASPMAAQDCPAGHRALDHELLDGITCVPQDPQRIAFTMEEINPAYILGGQSVVDSWYFQSFREKHPGLLAADKIPTVDVQSYPRSDAELLSLANPDLIVAFAGVANNAKAQHLAPMVEIQWHKDTTWRDLHGFIAYLLREQDKGQQMLAALDARIDQLKSDLGDRPRSFAIARAAEEVGAVQVFTKKNFGAVVLQQAGLTMGDGVLSPAAAQKIGSEWNYQMSAENLEALDVDHFFLLPSWSPENQRLILNSNLWQTLPVVQEGRVVTVPSDGEQFIRENIAYAHMIIDLVYDQVLGQPAAHSGNPNPFAAWLAD